MRERQELPSPRPSPPGAAPRPGRGTPRSPARRQARRPRGLSALPPADALERNREEEEEDLREESGAEEDVEENPDEEEDYDRHLPPNLRKLRDEEEKPKPSRPKKRRPQRGRRDWDQD